MRLRGFRSVWKSIKYIRLNDFTLDFSGVIFSINQNKKKRPNCWSFKCHTAMNSVSLEDLTIKFGQILNVDKWPIS